jgi:hypothetical protein
MAASLNIQHSAAAVTPVVVAGYSIVQLTFYSLYAKPDLSAGV